jgi:ribosome small subunit-dependent GTPase A
VKGRIIKLISNQYTVLLEDGNAVSCVAMGKMRLGKTLVCGDFVEVIAYEHQTGIESLLPRKNYLIRPPIANVDQALIVMSAVEPNFSSTLVDQLIFLVSINHIEPILIITKMDLADRDFSDIVEDYRRGGYQVLTTNKYEENSELPLILKDKVSVLTGQSGVGKSSLLNRLNPDFAIATQEISKALGRGKHTTRHSELLPVADGWVADTPGFSKLDFSKINKWELRESIRDFQAVQENCKFRDCMHRDEPDCAVKEAVEKKEISAIRYEHYLECLKMIEEEGVAEWLK